MAETFYMVETKKFNNKDNVDVISAVMNYSIVTGIAVSGYFSLLIGYMYQWVYGN